MTRKYCMINVCLDQGFIHLLLLLFALLTKAPLYCFLAFLPACLSVYVDK